MELDKYSWAMPYQMKRIFTEDPLDKIQDDNASVAEAGKETGKKKPASKGKKGPKGKGKKALTAL